MIVPPLIKRSKAGWKTWIYNIPDEILFNRLKWDMRVDKGKYDRVVYIWYIPVENYFTGIGWIIIPGIPIYVGKGDFRGERYRKYDGELWTIDDSRALTHEDDLLFDLLSERKYEYECAMFGFGTHKEIYALETNVLNTLQTKYDYCMSPIGEKHLKELPYLQLANKQTPKQYLDIMGEYLNLENQWK